MDSRHNSGVALMLNERTKAVNFIRSGLLVAVFTLAGCGQGEGVSEGVSLDAGRADE